MQPKKILLIDDDEDIREVAALTLETMGGFDVITAADGPSGLMAAERELPDAILLDLMMPGLDGLSTLRLLQESPAAHSIPVIFMTARVQPADRKRLSEVGARGILAKPFDPMTLADSLLALLDEPIVPVGGEKATQAMSHLSL